MTDPALLRERRKATFPTEALTVVWDGSREEVERRRELAQLIYDDPVFKHRSRSFLSREECYELAVRKSVRCVELFKEHDIQDPFERLEMLNTAHPFEANPFSLHTSMFGATLMTQATEELQEQWLEKAVNYQILGTYVQTELGHGTFLRGLETTATYDPESEEFVLHSPTLTSLKWWPGALGHTVNFAVVVAQLYSLGQCYGPHTFLVQLRSLDDHTPLSGITIGDIGPKLGYENVDNGFLKFEHHRIPYNHLLMKHNQLLPDGTYVRASSAKLTYGTMVLIRAMIIHHFSRYLSVAVTIATRYSAIRRQGKVADQQSEETCILDYRTQQYKLLPLLATCYAYSTVGHYMKSMTMGFYHDSRVTGDTQLLPELHALSAGLKAHCSWATATGIEVCRQACGGHGYMEAAGLSKLYREVVPACTYEGENTVMLLQTARYLMKCYSSRATIPDTASVSYLKQAPTRRGYVDDDVRTCDVIDAYRHRAQRMVIACSDTMDGFVKSGMTREDAWNRCSIQLVKAANAHCHYFLARTFHDSVEEHLEDIEDEAVRQLMRDLVAMYACHGLVENSGEFLEDGYVGERDVHRVRERVDHLLDRLRPLAVSIVDAFDHDDHLLQSALGCHDGRVYERLYEHARDSPLNKQTVHPVYSKYLEKMFKAKL